MRVLCVFGQHNYGDPVRGEGYEFSNFIPALRRLGHTVEHLEIWNRAARRNFRELNRALLATVERFRPDAVLAVQMHYEIWLETWTILRDSGMAATVNWATDDTWKYPQFSRWMAPAFHAFATTYPAAHARYRRDGHSRVLLTQWAANAESLQPPRPAVECRYPVSFVGTAHGNRRAWVEALSRRGVEVICFGHGWPRGPVAAADVPRIIRDSVISLNFANPDSFGGRLRPGLGNQIKARTFEIPGAGGFLLTEWAEGLEHCYTPEREMQVFRSPDELGGRISHFLARPSERDAIARAGHERTRRDHLYDRRLSELLDFALRQRDEWLAGAGRPPGGRIDWDAYYRAERRHVLGRGLRLLRRALIGACAVAWARQRGARAARRLTFELCWRLAGAWTYSAAGWPGRMFYSES